ILEQVSALEGDAEPLPERVGQAGDDEVTIARGKRLVRHQVGVPAAELAVSLPVGEHVGRDVREERDDGVEHRHLDPLARAGAVALDQRGARRLADVDREPALVAVQAREVEAADLGREAAGAVGVADAVAASRLLHLDDVGAQVAEQRRAPGARRLVREVDDADARQRRAPLRHHRSPAAALAYIPRLLPASASPRPRALTLWARPCLARRMAARLELPAGHPHVAVVTIDRPAQANALDPPTLREL